MHLLRAIPNAGKYLELSIEQDDYYTWQRGLFVGDPFAVVDGAVTIPDVPGWGVEIDPRWLESVTYTECALKNWKPSAYGSLYHQRGSPQDTAGEQSV